jgi:SNF2 family DNA or RNA helicase
LQGELQLRRRKAEVLTQLPPKRVVRLALELTPEQRRHYRAVEAQGSSAWVRPRW